MEILSPGHARSRVRNNKSLRSSPPESIRHQQSMLLKLEIIENYKNSCLYIFAVIYKTKKIFYPLNVCSAPFVVPRGSEKTQAGVSLDFLSSDVTSGGNVF